MMPQPDWFEEHDDLVTKRPAVDALTVDNVRQFLTASLDTMRRKDVAELKGLLAPTFVMHTYRPYGKNLEAVRLTLGGYMVWVTSWFQATDTSEYFMKVESIALVSPTEAVVTVVVSDPGNKELQDFLGPWIRETVNIGLYKNRLVVISVTVNR